MVLDLLYDDMHIGSLEDTLADYTAVDLKRSLESSRFLVVNYIDGSSGEIFIGVQVNHSEDNVYFSF